MPQPPAPLPVETLDRIRALRREGKSFAAIAGALTSDGVPAARGGCHWYSATVRDALIEKPPARAEGARAPQPQPKAKAAAPPPQLAVGQRRDTRPTVSADVVRTALALATAAAEPVFANGDGKRRFEPPRFATPARWAELRTLVHQLSADDRALVALRMLLECGARQTHEDSF